jgi:hypothetical protein
MIPFQQNNLPPDQLNNRIRSRTKGRCEIKMETLTVGRWHSVGILPDILVDNMVSRLRLILCCAFVRVLFALDLKSEIKRFKNVLSTLIGKTVGTGSIKN